MLKKVLLILGFSLYLCIPLPADEIYCHAASSLTDALTEIGQVFMNKNSEKVLFNFGASSLLATQIEEGAPGELFFSADEEKMDRLEKNDLIVKTSRKSLLSNILVIVSPSDSNARLQSPKDLRNIKGRIAIADYQSVPAGIYAREYLVKIGLWEELFERLVPVQNVRAALAAVETGNVEIGIVYKTDANISKRVRIAYEFPLKEGPRIRYSLAILKRSKNPAGAQKFYAQLLSPRSSEIFRKYGFIVLPPK